MDNEKPHVLLRKLVYTLDQMGSGLDAVDRGFGWTYFNETKRKSERLILQLPVEIQLRFDGLELGVHTWFTFHKLVVELLKEYPEEEQ